MASSRHELLCFNKTLDEFWDQALSKPRRKTLSEEGEKSEVNSETPGGVRCLHEQEYGVMEFEKDLNDVKIALDKISTLTDLVVSLVNKIDLEGTERWQNQLKREDNLKKGEDDLKRGENDLKRNEDNLKRKRRI